MEAPDAAAHGKNHHVTIFNSTSKHMCFEFNVGLLAKEKQMWEKAAVC